ncbi:hypothetical protein [Shewanella sp.]|uniref:hypothetical protein n=1 Tax=Shewanella sp. TaxID=50422 RepID=UPI003D0A262F
MEKLKHLNTKKFSDINQVAEKSMLCSNRKQAKIYQKYWSLYDAAVKNNNPLGHQEFPPQYIPVVQHLNGIVGNVSWYESSLVNWFVGGVISLFVAYIAFKVGW